MSFWFDQKHKEYAADGRESWIRAYVDRIFSASGDAVLQEQQQREQGDAATREALNQERERRQAMETAVNQRFETEANRRIAADQDLDNRLTQEQEMRLEEDKNIDKKLKTEKESILRNVDSERDDRKAADSALDARISREERLNRVYNADAGQFGSDNNTLAITIEGISSYNDLEGQTIRVNTLSYSNTNSVPANVYLNVNHLGNKAIRRPVPALQTGYDTKQYYTDLFHAREINRNTIMELTVKGGNVVWNNPISPARATAEQMAAGTDDASYVTPKLAAERFQTSEAAGNIKKNPADSTGDFISTHLTVGSRMTNTACGKNSFSCGERHTATGTCATVAGGQENAATALNTFIAGGEFNKASGNNSFSCGERGVSKGVSCFVGGGISNTADGNMSGTLAGTENKVKGYCPVAVGGEFNTLNGRSSCIAGGCLHNVSGDYAFAGGGDSNIAKSYNAVFGRFCVEPTPGDYTGTEGDALVVGIGEEDARSNAFRVTYSGDAYFKTTTHSTGADYAEMWEWQDGNPDGEDRVGRFVAMEGTKIRYAGAGDPCVRLGVVSARPSVAGDSYSDEWCGKYVTDIYGRWLTEHKSYEAVTDEAGEVIRPAYEADEYVLSPDYDPRKAYTPRNQRSEWAYVGTHGKLVVMDDGSCQPGGYARSNDHGFATAADEGFYVMERLDETHIRIYVR